MSKQLQKEIYKNAFELSEKFPEKPSLEAGLEKEIVYTKELTAKGSGGRDSSLREPENTGAFQGNEGSA